jgi:hypothetical protein
MRVESFRNRSFLKETPLIELSVPSRPGLYITSSKPRAFGDHVNVAKGS